MQRQFVFDKRNGRVQLTWDWIGSAPAKITEFKVQDMLRIIKGNEIHQ